MFAIRRLFALALTVANLPAHAAPVIHDGPSAPVAAWRAAIEAGDVTAMARLHDAATLAFPPGATETKGADAIMAGYEDLFAAYTVKVAVDEAHWVEQPPLVVSWGLTTLTLHPKPGGPQAGTPDIVSHTRFTDAATKIDGGWVYLVDHASVPKGR